MRGVSFLDRGDSNFLGPPACTLKSVILRCMVALETWKPAAHSLAAIARSLSPAFQHDLKVSAQAFERAENFWLGDLAMLDL